MSTRGIQYSNETTQRSGGEIDIVAKQERLIHFIEVKSKILNIDLIGKYIDSYKPEDGMHAWKLQRLRRTIQSYLAEKRVNSDWQFDVAIVYMDPISKKAKMKFMADIII